MSKTPPKSCAEDLWQVDVRLLQRRGLLVQGLEYGAPWPAGEQGTAYIRVNVHTEHLAICCTVGDQNGTPQEANFAVALERTACHLGGKRVWWRCPMAGCGRRVAILYCGAAIGCRHCLKLGYRCQRETAEDRASRQANKIRRRLGWVVGVLNPIGGKPKGMHWKTFNRLHALQDAHSVAVFGCIADSLGLIQPQLVGISMRSH